MKATARHILVDNEEICLELKKEIENGKSFAEVAEENSLCPSGADGGDLGTFRRGEMVPAFDKVVFTEAIGKVHGPIKTEFGYHLIEILNRA